MEGRCPECGGHYSPEGLRTVVARPTLGWFALLLPPAIIVPAYVVGMWTFFCGGFLVVYGSWLTSLVLSFTVGYRIARWRFSVLNRKRRRSPRFALLYVGAITVALAALQITVSFAVLYS